MRCVRDQQALCAGSERLREIGDQVVGMLDANGQADGAFQDADALAHIKRHARMRHRGGVAGERFRAAQADGELEYLQRVEEGEGGRLATLDVEGEGRAGARTLCREDATRLRRWL